MSNFTAYFRVYNPNDLSTTIISEVLPNHVTITGREDFFDMAYHDAQMIKRGMEIALDKSAPKPEGDKVENIPARVRIYIDTIKGG